jgi:hypothetical protein
MEVAPLDRGVMDAGENEQLKFTGKPAQLSAIRLLKLPEASVTLTVVLPTPPFAITNDDGFADNVKLGGSGGAGSGGSGGAGGGAQLRLKLTPADI